MPSAVARRLLSTPSPAISNALARDTTRCAAVALRAHIPRVLLSSALSDSGAAGRFMPTRMLLKARLTVKQFWGHLDGRFSADRFVAPQLGHGAEDGGPFAVEERDDAPHGNCRPGERVDQLFGHRGRRRAARRRLVLLRPRRNCLLLRRGRSVHEPGGDVDVRCVDLDGGLQAARPATRERIRGGRRASEETPMPAGCSAPCRSFGQPLLPNARSAVGSPMPRPSSLTVIRRLSRRCVMSTDVALDPRAFWRIGELAPPVLGQPHDAFRAVEDEVPGVVPGRPAQAAR